MPKETQVNVPEVLDAMVDVVLSYRPKAKIKKALKRKKRKEKGS